MAGPCTWQCTRCPIQMTTELPKHYDPAAIQQPVTERWLKADAFCAVPDEREARYVIMMPLPNITGALHMGHALDNVMQDLLIRWHRMRGDNTLWMPGTDHAGIATQAVVERRLFESEGKTRNDIGREALVQRIHDWKEQYQARIAKQQQAMGCSCDWGRQRFTMDPVYRRAVRECFFRLFEDGLIYRGNRLVNWDCVLETAIADDEIEYVTVQGAFWHLRYPVMDPLAGEPEYVTVVTTRPETMLGDTAVACHPDPEARFAAVISATEERIETASQADRPALEAEHDRLVEQKKTKLPGLLLLVEMAKKGRKIRLPILGREIPLIVDEWAKPEKGSGCVKITPAHDPNDYEVWQRHADEIGIINILEADGRLNEAAGPYAGQDRADARKNVVLAMDELGLLAETEEREVEVGHSDRSKTPIEPYLSRQWFVRMGDTEGGILMGRGTPNEFQTKGLAQAAIDAVQGNWRSKTGRKLTFHPDATRYGNTFCSWLAEKRDWCISRQLWWGHQIPIWHGSFAAVALSRLESEILEGNGVHVRVEDASGEYLGLKEALSRALADKDSGPYHVQVCLRSAEEDEKHEEKLAALGLLQDKDVLDTWFSSQLFPFATLGWPDPATAKIDEGQRPLGSVDGKADALSYYYPGSCLVTGRDIITLWVARMVIAGLYIHGDVPFADCFIHANIQDGKGERMSKSKGNGIDPVDIIEQYGADAMRYVLCDMQTGMQDIRLPVQAISPFTGKLVDLTHAKHGRSVFTYMDPEVGKEFDVLGHMPDLPAAKIISDRFEVGRNFCNKLWNAARFALIHLQDLEEQDWTPLAQDELLSEDRWILSCLTRSIQDIDMHLSAYNPSAAISRAREFFWSELCDWYLELIKQRLRNEALAPKARQVLAFAMDQILRLLHPFLPFVTEALFEKLGECVPVRGIDAPLDEDSALKETALLCHASWPQARPGWIDEALEADFVLMQDVVRAIRDLRQKYQIAQSRKLACSIKAKAGCGEALARQRSHMMASCALESLEISELVERPALSAAQIVGEVEIYLAGVVDPQKERERLDKQAERLQGLIEQEQKKLASENFVKRAPGPVVQAERKRLEEHEAQLQIVQRHRSELP